MFDTDSGFEELTAVWPNKKGSEAARPLYDALVNGDEAQLCHRALLTAVKMDAASKFLAKSTLSSYLQRRHGAVAKQAQQQRPIQQKPARNDCEGIFASDCDLAGPGSAAEEGGACDFIEHCVRRVWLHEDCDTSMWADQNGWDVKTGDTDLVFDAIRDEIEPWTTAAIERGDHQGTCGDIGDMAGCRCYVPWVAAAADWVSRALGGCGGIIDFGSYILDELYSDRYCYWLATLPPATYRRIHQYKGRHIQPRIADGMLVRGSERTKAADNAMSFYKNGE